MIAEIEEFSGFVYLYAAVGLALEFVTSSCVTFKAVKGRAKAAASSFSLRDVFAK